MSNVVWWLIGIAVCLWIVLTAVDALGIGQPANRVCKIIAGVLALLALAEVFNLINIW
jgi:uncharacterized membrane protein